MINLLTTAALGCRKKLLLSFEDESPCGANVTSSRRGKPGTALQKDKILTEMVPAWTDFMVRFNTECRFKKNGIKPKL